MIIIGNGRPWKDKIKAVAWSGLSLRFGQVEAGEGQEQERRTSTPKNDNTVNRRHIPI